MATRQNRFWNNPEFAAIASNLSGMFAPPSAQDEYAYTKAASERAEAARIADLYAAAGDDFDRMGVAAGQWAPNQSYYSVDQANATDRRGQDVSASATMRGQDISAATSRANNLEDNRYGLAGDIATTVVGEGERALGTTVLDEDIAAAAGLVPGMTMEGRASPLSTDEVIAAAMSNEVGRDPGYEQQLAFGELDPVKVVSPISGEPIYASEGQAIRQSLPAYVDQGGRAGGQPIEYTVDGQRQYGSYDPNTQTYTTADGQPLPPNATDVVELGQLQGDREGLGQSTVNTADRQYASSVEALDLINDLEANLLANPGATGIAGGIQRMSQNLVATVDEMSQAFGGKTPSFDELMNSGVAGVFDETGQNLTGAYFNEGLSENEMLTNQLVWAYAAANQSDGRVSNQQMEQARQALGINGVLSNNQQVLAAARQLRTFYERKLGRLGALASPEVVQAYGSGGAPGQPAGVTAQPTTGPQPGMVEDGYRFVGGDPADPNSWEPVQ